MTEKELDYPKLVERALRQVVRDALSTVAEHGLTGRHHLYITFRTDHPEVGLPDDLRLRYPREMTMVLQHEFWDLEVGEDGFAVTLSFNEVPYRLEIPFAAITVFADPSVEFGLQFTPDGELAAVDEDHAEAAIHELPSAGSESRPEAGAEVVALDTFRKK